MFKFKARFSETGTFVVNGVKYSFSNRMFETEDKDLAKHLRENNGNFVEMQDEVEVETDSELEGLKAKATELKIPFGINIGAKTLKERIEKKQKEVEEAE